MNVKEKIKHNKLTQWEVAEAMEPKISEFTLSRYLRKNGENLSEELIDRIEKAIKELTNR